MTFEAVSSSHNRFILKIKIDLFIPSQWLYLRSRNQKNCGKKKIPFFSESATPSAPVCSAPAMRKRQSHARRTRVRCGRSGRSGLRAALHAGEVGGTRNGFRGIQHYCIFDTLHIGNIVRSFFQKRNDLLTD